MATRDDYPQSIQAAAQAAYEQYSADNQTDFDWVTLDEPVAVDWCELETVAPALLVSADALCQDGHVDAERGELVEPWARAMPVHRRMWVAWAALSEDDRAAVCALYEQHFVSVVGMPIALYWNSLPLAYRGAGKYPSLDTLPISKIDYWRIQWATQ